MRKNSFGYTAPGYTAPNTRYVFPNYRVDDLLGESLPVMTGLYSEVKVGGLQRFNRMPSVSAETNS